MVATLKKRPLRYLFRARVYLYHWHLGWLLGHRFLLLTHIGRKTGLRRQTVLEVVEHRKDNDEAVVMSGFGRHSDWLLNINVNPEVEVQLGSRRFFATHRVLGKDEAIQVLKGYEQRNRFAAPIVQRVLSWLVGWSYRGTDDDRSRLVSELPLIAFRPRIR
jgi:deazaflavin-dependent oxidoreductase (nitroreductase family)